MSYNIKGEVQTTGTMIIQSKSPGLNIKLTGDGLTYTPDTNGEITLPITMQDEIDDIFAQIPLSQYGAINNNAPGVAGTFDGGSTVAYYSASPVLLEDDGSLVYLRPGTNGSTINYYYTYVNNPNASLQPFTTIKKYYEGSWNNILFSGSDAKTCLVYEEVANNVLHLVLTNGTLNKESHQSASIARSLIPEYIMTSIVAGAYMYIVTMFATNFNINNPTGVQQLPNDPFQFYVYQIPVSQIQAGSVTTVTKMTGITGNTLYGAQGAQSFIRIADAWSSTSGGNAFIRSQAAFNETTAYTYSMPGMCQSAFDGTNIVFNMTTNCFARNNSARTDTMYSFRVFFNPSTKVFSTDLTANTPLVATGAATGTITWTNPYAVTSTNLFGTGTANSDSLHGLSYTTENGTQYYIREKYVLSDTYFIYSGKVNNFTTKVNAFNVRGRTFTNFVQYEVNQDFASRVGDQLLAAQPISSSRIVFSGTGTYNGTAYNKYRKGIADIGTTRTYTYNSFTNGTVTGYAPQAYRVQPTDTFENLTFGGISYCDISGNVQFYGTLFYEGRLTIGNKLDPVTLTYDKTMTISNTVLQNLKSAILSAAGVSSSSSTIGLYYSPLTSYFTSIACVSSLNPSGGGDLILASVNCTADTSNVLTATVNTIINNYHESSMTGIAAPSEMLRHGGLSVVNYSDFTYVSLPHIVGIIVPGDSEEYTYAGVKSGNTLTNLLMNRSYHAPDLFTTAREYSYIPNYGFGYYMFTNSDKGTKLMFKYCGNTLAQYNSNMSAGTGTQTVILAQDVIQGFYLYFTEVTPVLMNGKYFELPITAIDLSTVQANPGNTLFYVYVDSSTGTPGYKVTTTQVAESLTNMFIGTIQTDGTKVSALNINKVSRFNIYRPSETQIGSAFPVSTGNPAQTGSISW